MAHLPPMLIIAGVVSPPSPPSPPPLTGLVSQLTLSCLATGRYILVAPASAGASLGFGKPSPTKPLLINRDNNQT